MPALSDETQKEAYSLYSLYSANRSISFIHPQQQKSAPSICSVHLVLFC